MRPTRARKVTVAGAAFAFFVAGAAVTGAGIANARGTTDTDGDVKSTAIALAGEVSLAPIVAEWPDAYSVAGSKSEPLYTERITFSRDADLFVLRIEVIAQGDTALGTQRGAVRVAGDGTITWVAGCTKDAAACENDPALRGFLTTAALVGLERTGRLPETGTARALHGTPVVCVDDDAVHPDTAPSIAGLAPCFSIATGALLGHWSAASAAFVGPTLAPGFAETSERDEALFGELFGGVLP